MTPQERKAIRDEKLIAYLDTVDDRKAHCGQLSRIIETFSGASSASTTKRRCESR